MTLTPRPFRLVVSGGPDYDDAMHIQRVLGEIDRDLGPITLLIEGEAGSADTIAKTWAVSRAIRVLPVHADRRTHGRDAAGQRNQRMLDEGKPHLVVVFPDGRDIDDLVARARSSGFPVRDERPTSHP